ncbi:MAG: DUF2007 domain-containing protein [Candidatus Omnitrophota bacterium]|jgi:hypothetical protein|nr:MAG: DUF2007 domain-containing protein [Candidatus Omnitrophota bacterium]
MEADKLYKEVYVTMNPFHVAFIKSLLESEGIDFIIEGENFLQIRPLAVPARIKVESSQFEQAIQLLEEFRNDHSEGGIK